MKYFDWIIYLAIVISAWGAGIIYMLGEVEKAISKLTGDNDAEKNQAPEN